MSAPVRWLGGWVVVLGLASGVAGCSKRPAGSIVLRLSTGHPPGEVAAGLTVLGLDRAARPEALAPAEFVRLLRWSA